MWDTAKFFKAGHRIRVAISSSNYPRFDINPNTGAGPALEHTNTVIAHNTIYLDSNRPSHMVLPVVGPDNDANGVPDYVDAVDDVEGEPEGLNTVGIHSADQNANNRISLSELLRLFQFFNARSFSCAVPPGSTEDGYQAGPGDTSCTPHDVDFNDPNWSLSLSELLRIIQLFNSDGYHHCPDFDPPSEDGYCPGLSG